MTTNCDEIVKSIQVEAVASLLAMRVLELGIPNPIGELVAEFERSKYQFSPCERGMVLEITAVATHILAGTTHLIEDMYPGLKNRRLHAQHKNHHEEW